MIQHLHAAWRSWARAFASFVLVLAFVMGSAMPSLAIGGLTGQLLGTIVDQSTKAPISGATILATSPSARFRATTDARGFFQINGVTVDTYTVHITAPGYAAFDLTGVTVQGDQPTDIQTVTIQKTIQVIGGTRARAQSAVFQPGQTTDAYTVSGDRAIQATGKAAASNENALALSVPGVTLTNAGRLTIRGGRAVDVGYQVDGVNLTEPFNATNGTVNRFNGLGSLQVVAGAGDASQGNVGGGVLNLVIKRGQRPPFGFIDAEATAPNFGHQFAFEYGWATPDNRFSNYTAYNGYRTTPYGAGIAAYGIPAPEIGGQFGTTYQTNDDLINNFVYRFGKDQNQGLQALFQVRNLSNYAGDVYNYQYYPYNPYTQRGVGAAPPNSGGYASDAAFFANKVFLSAYTPTSNQTINGPLASWNPMRYLKFEYTNSLNPTTYLALRYYNWGVYNGSDTDWTTTTSPRYTRTGGDRIGTSGELTKTLNDKHTLQLGFLAETSHPIWDSTLPIDGYNTFAGFNGDPGEANLWDFVNPANVNAPISASNPCPINVTAANPAGDPNGCYLYRTGQFYGTGVGRVPAFAIQYNKTAFRQYAWFLQDTFSPSRFFKLQAGVRGDYGSFSTGQNPYNPTDRFNPQDVDPNTISGIYTSPHYLEPRATLDYINKASSLRVSYGRSVEFPRAQTFGTPGGIAGVDPRFNGIAAKGNALADPTTWNCGSGYNTKWLPKGGDPVNSPNGGVGSPYGDGGVGGYFQCSNYYQQSAWLLDQNNDAPDLGGNQPETQSNYDATLQHQFRNGFSVRLTGFARNGYNVAATQLLKAIYDPITGQPVSQVFGIGNGASTHTYGAELGVQLPQRAYGLSGYISATYINEFSSVPPLVAGEDNLPLVSSSSIALNNLYRAGFVSPFTANAGFSYRFKNGFRINPIFNYDRGYPIGVGNLTASGGRIGATINGVNSNIPQTNFNSVTQPAQVASNGSAGAVAATNYVDPVNPGNYFRPNIAATRGTPETSAAGGFLSRPRLNTDVAFEFQQRRNTFGLLVSNVFGNVYSEPQLNPYWQPVATGVGGVNTGLNAAGVPGTLSYTLGGFRNYTSSRYGNQPYVETPNGAPLGLRFYYQLAL